jgi:hypothetical protein
MPFNFQLWGKDNGPILETDNPGSSNTEQPESVLEIKEERPAEKSLASKRSIRELETEEEEAPAKKRPRKPKEIPAAAAPPKENSR